MKIRQIIMMVTLCAVLCGTVVANRELERSEVLDLFHELTSNPRKTWISEGQIEAAHQEYRAVKITDEAEIKQRIRETITQYQANPNKIERAEFLQKMRLDATPFNVRYELSNEYTMETREKVKFDGEKFYWSIDVVSREDSVSPEKDLQGNYMTNQFNIELNKHRIFTWDGENYTIYTPAAEHARVDSAGFRTRNVTGALTAGIIPWGYGNYSHENLIGYTSSATEYFVGGQQRIELVLVTDNSEEMTFVIDPSRDNAVLSCRISGVGQTITTKQYDQYEYFRNSWVPTSILLEKRDSSSNDLIASDLWDITSVDTNSLGSDAFSVVFANDTVVEYESTMTDKPVMYRHSDTIDTSAMLADKLIYASNTGDARQNCATASMKYALDRLGLSVSDTQLEALVEDPIGDTSLLAMKSFAEDLGLNCRAAYIDLDILRELDSCQVLLYLPGKKHFVVLDYIDTDYVRVVDLASRKFYYRIDVSFFDMDWPDGTALILANSNIEGEFNEIEETSLQEIRGAAYYDCNTLIQQYSFQLCVYFAGECLSYEIEYYNRWGCGESESGSCSTTWFERCIVAPCMNNPYDPEDCTIGNWTAYWMRACL